MDNKRFISEMKSVRALMWTVLVFASIGLIFTFIEKEWEIFSYCVVFISMCPLLYLGVSRYKEGIVKPYRPGRGYRSYRRLARKEITDDIQPHNLHVRCWRLWMEYIWEKILRSMTITR